MATGATEGLSDDDLALKLPDWLSTTMAATSVAKRAGAGEAESSEAKKLKADEAAKQDLTIAAKKGDERRVLTLLLKIACDHDNLLRDLIGAVYRCFLVDADDQTPVAMKAATVAWDKETREKKEAGEKPAAPPFLTAFCGLLRSLLQRQDIPLDAKATLKHFWDTIILSMPPDALADHIRHCRLKELKDFSNSAKESAPKSERVKRARIQFFVLAWSPPSLETVYTDQSLPLPP